MSSPANAFGISGSTVSDLMRIFATTPGVDRVWIFGSRAPNAEGKITARENSDIDLAVDAPEMQPDGFKTLTRRLDQLNTLYRLDVVHWQSAEPGAFRREVEKRRAVFWEPKRQSADIADIGGTELKPFQATVLDTLGKYFDELVKQRANAEVVVSKLREVAMEPTADMLDYPKMAWTQMGKRGELPPAFAAQPYSSRTDGAGLPIPNACLKVPTGGGKTLLAAAAVARAQSAYFGKRNGLVLWIMPNEAIYSQTKKRLTDRDHPYRQMLNVAAGGRVKILEKDSPLTRLDVDSHLCVMLLMLQSAARQSKETLRFFRDRGSVHGFFPREDDFPGHHALLQRIPNLDIYGADPRQLGSTIKDSLGNVMRVCRPMVIIDEGHHSYTENALKTIDGFNPSLVLELSATPRIGKAGQHGANVLVDVRGRDLDEAEMIKLPINVEAQPWADWQSCLAASLAKLNELQTEAQALQADTARYIRPILLVQVERTGEEQRGGGYIHAEDAREYLLQLGLHAEEVALKTSEKDELKQLENIDLLSPQCRIRAIITKQALQEGWDCPFAYVLCALAAGRNPGAMTQLVGRILRQPDVAKTGRAKLDECHVFCHDIKTSEVVGHIKKSLEGEGMGDLAVSVRNDSDTGNAPDARHLTRRPAFQGLKLFLPKVTWHGESKARELVYESDVLANIRWDALIDENVAGEWAPDASAKGRTHFAVGLEILEGRKQNFGPESDALPAELDRAALVRAVLDIVPNAWVAWRIVERAVTRVEQRGFATEAIARSSASLIERLRADLTALRDRAAEAVFTQQVADQLIRFSLKASDRAYELPHSLTDYLPPGARTLQGDDGGTIEKSLLEPVFEAHFDSTLERNVACYLDRQKALIWWHRNVARTQYGLQGWKRNKVYPDIVFAMDARDGRRKWVLLETKGLHLKNEDTAYKKDLLAALSRIQGTARSTVGELALEDDSGAEIVCDLVFDEDWEGTLSGRYFNTSASA